MLGDMESALDSWAEMPEIRVTPSPKYMIGQMWFLKAFYFGLTLLSVKLVNTEQFWKTQPTFSFLAQFALDTNAMAYWQTCPQSSFFGSEAHFWFFTPM